jgi:hypothetical protein
VPSIEIYRARIERANVARLLRIRADAVAEFQEQVPELLRAELVRLDDETWLDMLVWSEPVDEERISRASQVTPAAAEMHGLITDVLEHDRGEIVHSTHGTWASAR